jgi:hypothetical protein
MRRSNLQKYRDAVCAVHELCSNEVPIKVSEFMSRMYLTNYFFDAMKHLGIIEPIIGNHREGIIFSFKQMADNETYAHIAVRVCDLMSEWTKSKNKPAAGLKQVPKKTIAVEPRPNSHQNLNKEEVDALIGRLDKMIEPKTEPKIVPIVNSKKKGKAAVMITFEYSGDMNKLMEQITGLLDGKTAAKFVIEAKVD